MLQNLVAFLYYKKKTQKKIIGEGKCINNSTRIKFKNMINRQHNIYYVSIYVCVYMCIHTLIYNIYSVFNNKPNYYLLYASIEKAEKNQTK